MDNAKDTLELVTKSGLSSVFLARSNDRKKARRMWTAGVIVAIISVAIAINFAVDGLGEALAEIDTFNAWILRFAIVAPFLYVLYFVTKQYSKERDLEEKYAFKALVSQTLQNNTKLLREEFIEDSKMA